MNQIAELCRDLKKDFKPKIQNPASPVSCWSEKDLLDGKVVDAFVIIFRTRGCSWALRSGCSMCGYFNDSLWEKISDEDMIRQFDTVMEKYAGEKFVKIFTSGSFLDEKEISSKVRKKILSRLVETADKVSVESRPEYVKEETLSEIKDIFQEKTFEIGIGLETANDHIREHYLNKGFAFDDYKKAAKTLKKYNFKLKTYVLIKPLFMSEKESIDDAINTVEKIKNITDTVSFNPTNIQRNTLVNYLWRRKQYRSSWLWSIVEILRQSKKTAPNVYIKCDISGGGGIRGAHNCKNCDHDFLDKISKFSLSQDTKSFQNLKCECHEKWQDLLDIENLGFGSLINI